MSESDERLAEKHFREFERRKNIKNSIITTDVIAILNLLHFLLENNTLVIA